MINDLDMEKLYSNLIGPLADLHLQRSEICASLCITFCHNLYIYMKMYEMNECMKE